MTPDEARTAIDSMGGAFAAADIEAVLAMFSADEDVMYAGSEVGEVAVGRAALRRLLLVVFAREERYSWHCHAVHVTPCPSGFAVLGEATLTVHATPSPDHNTKNPGAMVDSFPYRVSGLIEKGSGHWRWRFCQGSEPVGAVD